MIFIAVSKDGGKVTYHDTKRHLWWASVLSPSVPGLSALMLAWSGQPLWSLVPLAFYYLVVPILDVAFGEDTNNPPEEVVEQLSDDSY
ncbi:hypothetical protein [Hoeflea sp.]|uniref:hypothetical protein n=1 Tax=Hoeflea sp. TaxID=1940281 RepID=UPI003B023439